MSGVGLRLVDRNPRSGVGPGGPLYRSAAPPLSLFQDRVRTVPNRPAIVDSDGVLSFAEAWDLAGRWARALRSVGVGPGGVVSYQVVNGRAVPLLDLAIWRTGALPNPLVHLFAEAELRYILEGLRPAAIIGAPADRGGTLWSTLRAAADVSPDSVQLAIDGPSLISADGSAVRTAPEAEGASRPNPGRIAAADPCVLVFSSGTTGRPKGVVHSHASALASCDVLIESCGLTPGNGTLNLMPAGLGSSVYGLALAAALGGPSIWVPAQDAAAVASLAAQFGPLCASGPTPFATLLIEACKSRGVMLDGQPFVCGGAPIPRSLAREAKEVGLVFVPCFGSIEGMFVNILRYDATEDEVSGADGRPAPWTEVRVLDEDGAVVTQPGIVGEMVHRGPQLFLGYADVGPDSPSPPTFDEEGFFRSGDLASWREDGTIVFVSRMKDVIVRNGMKVSPVEIERVLEQGEPGWKDRMVVVGVSDDRVGERACLCLERDLWTGSAEQVLETARRHLEEAGVARYKWPELTRPVDALPRNAAGKVLRREMRELVGRTP